MQYIVIKDFLKNKNSHFVCLCHAGLGCWNNDFIVYTQDPRFTQWTADNGTLFSENPCYSAHLGNGTRQEVPNQHGNLDVN